jgi:type I restriction-modification system DNA methylase subunit
MTAPDIVKNLVARFEQHRDSYRSGRYNETQLRREFLDPFFEALGWDIFNKQNYAEIYKDVIHEDSLEIEGEKKAPDYAFRIGGTRKFFVEAKKPSVNIEMNIHPAFQLRRYAWSAKLPLGILTDFEEFAVYDCRIRPDKDDKASTGRVMLLSYKDYIEKWDEIAAIFSHEAVLRGSFDRYAEGMRTKKGTTEVDDAFLAEIERWRDLLARNIALRNPNLSVRELNYAVQMTIDRIVFLRICEDRGVERDEQLKEISAERNVYENLCQLFQRADMRYNSGLFHFKNEKEQSSGADTLTLGLKINDKVLQDILKNLYYPESPYVFREIPSDILGQVYERFLGKVIRLTAGHQAKVEEKPEVRKAGGVFYTPTFIVEYIVLNTVGKLLEGKTPKEVVRLKFLDPACGSGTFPLGAFQYLLDWHLKWYLEHEPEKWMIGRNPAIYQSKDGYKLTTAKKKEILLNNIFGVDIDPQAVEVTKLSLLLKVLEGESNETIGSQLTLFQERVLPDLGRNIKCGNSLIGYDYFEGRMLVEQEERERVNAFDWKAEFPQVFAQGGFDAVFGNPPYVRQEMISELKSYLQRHYKIFSSTADLYAYFIELSLRITKPGGKFSFIVSSKFVRSSYGEKLRKFIPTQSVIEQFLDFGDLPVFEGATVYPCIFVLEKEADSNKRDENKIVVCNVKTLTFRGLDEYVNQNSFIIPQVNLNNGTWQLHPSDEQDLLAKISGAGKVLSQYCGSEPLRGVLTGLNEVFIVPDERIDEIIRGMDNERDIFLPYLRGRNVNRYSYEHTGENLLFSDGISEAGYPNVMSYLKAHRRALEARTDIQGTSKKWYELRPCKYYDLLRKPKIIYSSVAQNGTFVLDEEGTFIDKTCYFIPSKDKYLLGLLNSKLLFYYFSHIAVQRRGGYFEYLTIYVSQLPIRPVNFSEPAEKAMHDKMVSLVERMLELHKRSPRTPQEQEMVKREIESTDVRIDRLVYALYGLSEDEVKVVEGKE